MTKIPSRSDAPRLDSSRRLAACALAVCLIVCAGSVPPLSARAAARPDAGTAGVVRTETIADLLARWEPDTHLYVFGDVDDIGLSEAALAELAGWLGDHHWTVVLIEDASGLTYVDSEGIERRDDYAIEYGTGQGIPKQAGFSVQVHPRTGEPDGAILAIALAQRYLFYTGSDAQDRRGLGEEQFAGNLDRWAIDALRRGDIAAAVRDTVTGIDGELDAAISREEAAVAAELSSALEAAKRAEKVRRAQTIFFSLLLTVLAVMAGIVLNHRRRPDKLRAERLLAAWRAALDKKLEVLLDELERRVARYVGPASGTSGQGRLPYTGETLRLAEQIRADVGSLYILWTSASSVLQQAAARIEARGLGAVRNFFLPGGYRQGIALLEHEPVPFDPAEGLPKLFGPERTWQDDLLGDLASYQPFRKSFQEIVAELDTRSARAVEALALIESSVTQGPAALDETEETIRHTRALRRGIEDGAFADGLGLFLVPAVFATALPAGSDALGQARALFPNDPVTALRGDGAKARRIAVEAAQLAGLAAASRSGILPVLAASIAALRAASVGTGWIETGRRQLSDRADLLARQTADESVRTEIEELAQALAGLGSRVERAVALTEALDGIARPEIRRVTDEVRTARAELGAALSLAPERLLREASLDPSARLEEAIRRCDEVQSALGRGGLDDAAAGLDEAERLTEEAGGIVEESREAFAAHEPTVAERRAETARVEALVPDHDHILAEIAAGFAPSVLLLRADDPEHPGANVHLGDNLDEARIHVGLSHEKLGRALAAHADGRLLAAADLLEEVKGHQEFAVHRLEEIAERRARLERTAASNRPLLEELEALVREDERAVAGDPRVMRPTLEAFERGRRQLEQARRSVEAAPGDPLIAEDELVAARTTLAEVHERRAPADRLLHAEAQRSLEAAQRQLAAAGTLAQRAQGDRIPDSAGTTEALRTLESLSAAHTQAREALTVEHGDWKWLDTEADRIAAEAALQAATLTGELAKGEKAVTSVSNAAEWVRRARTWSSSYGVYISGEPGAGALSQARQLLEQGRYEEANQEARRAYSAATIAIEEAEEAVEAEKDRRTEERRRRERASFSSSSSSSSSRSFGGFGGSGSSGGSSSRSSSSGSGRSSWGGSSSGSGRSSWSGSRSGSGRSSW